MSPFGSTRSSSHATRQLVGPHVTAGKIWSPGPPAMRMPAVSSTARAGVTRAAKTSLSVPLSALQVSQKLVPSHDTSLTSPDVLMVTGGESSTVPDCVTPVARSTPSDADQATRQLVPLQALWGSYRLTVLVPIV